MENASIVKGYFNRSVTLIVICAAIVCTALLLLCASLSRFSLSLPLLVFGFLIGTGLLILFFIRPFYLLLVFLITIPVSYQFEIGSLGTVLKPLGFLLIVCSIPSLLLNRKTFFVNIRTTDWWILGFIAAAFLSLFSFIYPLKSIVGFIFIVGDCLFYFLCVFLIDSIKKMKWAVGVLIASFAISSVIAIVQMIAFHMFRVQGTFTDPNYFALGILPMIFICLYIFWSYPRWSGRKILMGVLFLLFVVTLPLTLSRSGLLSLVLMLVLAFFRTKKTRYLFFIVAVVILVALIFLPPWILEGFKWESITGGYRLLSVQLRESFLHSGLRIFSDHPIIGVGVDNFRFVFHSYSLTFPSIIEAFAHNTYLEILVGMGVVGIIPFLGVLVSALRNFHIARAVFQPAHRFEFYLSEGLQMGLLVYLVDIFFLTAQHDKLFWLLIALSTAMMKLAPRQPTPGGAPLPDA